MRSDATLLLLLFIALVWAGCPTTADDDAGDDDAGDDDATDDDVTVDDLDAVLEPVRVQAGLPALGAAVVQGNDVIALGMTGERQYGEGTAVEPDDPFHLGSCTKAMTATLTATLVEDGVVSWDTTLPEAFPGIEMDPGYQDVTLRQLLCHQGGVMGNILDYPQIWNPLWTMIEPLDEQRYWFAEQVLTMPPETEPGTEFVYSNPGYMIVGAALEQATGSTWEDLIQQRLFDPLGMSSCGFGPPATPGTVDAPWGHNTGGGEPVPVDPGSLYADNPPALGPAGTVHCDLWDWAAFASSHLGGASGDESFLTTETWGIMHTPWPGSDYALGWGVVDRDWAGGTALNHNGSNTMFYAVAWLALPKQQAYLAVTNIGDAGAPLDEAIVELIELYAGE